MEKRLCRDCPKRNRCVKLCVDAEEYVNQDYVSQKEYMIMAKPYQSLENFFDNDDTWNRVNIEKRRLKSLIIQLTEDGKSTSEIVYQLPCSDSYTRRIRRRYFKKQKKNE